MWCNFIIFQVLLIQVKCYQEIISIGYQVYRIHGLPWFRSLSWYFLITLNYFYYGESLFDSMGTLISRDEIFRFLITYHRFISFCLYFIGFLWFILSLVKKYILKQFLLLGWTQFALMIPVLQSYQLLENMFEGEFRIGFFLNFLNTFDLLFFRNNLVYCSYIDDYYQ